MNGRIYDPKLGRMLQADPFVQNPKNSQSLNRYSYVLNNPLSYTDPSGYFSFKKWARIIVAVAASYITYGAASGWAAGWLAGTALAGNSIAIGAIAGGIAGFVGGAIATGSVKGAFTGALTGAAGGALGGAIAGNSSTSTSAASGSSGVASDPTAVQVTSAAQSQAQAPVVASGASSANSTALELPKLVVTSSQASVPPASWMSASLTAAATAGVSNALAAYRHITSGDWGGVDYSSVQSAQAQLERYLGIQSRWEFQALWHHFQKMQLAGSIAVNAAITFVPLGSTGLLGRGSALTTGQLAKQFASSPTRIGTVRNVLTADGGLRTSKTVAGHLLGNRSYIPNQSILDTIGSGARVVDPQGVVGRFLYTSPATFSGSRGVLEVLVNETDGVIEHVLFKSL